MANITERRRKVWQAADLIIYFILTYTCSRILRYFEGKMDGSDSYDLATTDTLTFTSGLYRYPDKKKEDDDE